MKCTFEKIPEIKETCNLSSSKVFFIAGNYHFFDLHVFQKAEKEYSLDIMYRAIEAKSFPVAVLSCC